MRFMRSAVCGAIDRAGSTSASRLMPSGVSSNTQANTSIGTKPITTSVTSACMAQSGVWKIGSTVPATCTINQAPTRYSPAMRITLRRLSSASRLMVTS